MNSDRFGGAMVVASVLATCMIVGLLYWHQVRAHRDNMRINGVAIVRALSVADIERLAPAGTPASGSLLGALTSVQRSDALAYGVVVGKTGEKLFEVTAPGAIVPQAVMPKEPAMWFGEHFLASPGDDRKIREFYGPILSGADLMGFVRVGYYDRPGFLLLANLSYVGMMALPIFLLSALSMLMIKSQLRPLSMLAEQMKDAWTTLGVPSRPVKNFEPRQFAQRFDEFMTAVEIRVRETQQQRLDAQAAGRLLSYKLKRTEAVLDSIPDGVLVLDEACVVTFANQKAGPIFGVGLQSLLGEEPEKWCTHAPVLDHLQRIRHEGGAAVHVGNFEYSPEEQGDRRIALASCSLYSPHDSERLSGILLVLRDVSHQFLAKRAGLDFVNRVSHDLKSPLDTLSSYSELLLGYSGLTENERVDAVNVIHDQVARAGTLIHNLLNISKLESGTLPISRHRVKVQELLEDTIEVMRASADSSKVSLELTISPNLPPARLDKDLMRVVLDNTVSNAIKYSNPGGRVTLRAQETDALELEIVVSDEGLGISAEDCEKVFDKHYRANTEDVLARSGHGLGLYLVRQFVELHHGSIRVSSELGKGSQFTIRLPLHAAQLEETATA